MPDPFDPSRMRIEFNDGSGSEDSDAVGDLFLRAIQLGRDQHPQGSSTYPTEVVSSAEEMWKTAPSNSVTGKLEAVVLFLIELNAYSLELQTTKNGDLSYARALQLESLNLLREIEDHRVEVKTYRRNSKVKPGQPGNLPISVGEALTYLAEDKTAAGKDGARAFHLLVENVCTYVFGPSLIDPKIEASRHDGIKVVDIAYTNVADSGFFAWLRSTINCMFVWVEVKNYGADPVNPEVDQLAGRLNSAAGMFGILITRKIKDRKRMNRRASRLFTDGKWVVVLDLEDLRAIARERKHEGSMFPYLRRRMRDVVAHW